MSAAGQAAVIPRPAATTLPKGRRSRATAVAIPKEPPPGFAAEIPVPTLDEASPKQIVFKNNPLAQQLFEAWSKESGEFNSLPANSPGHTEEVRGIVNHIALAQTLRKFAIKGQQWCDRRTENLIAAQLGYDPLGGDSVSRKAMFKKAASIRVAIEKTGDIPTDCGLATGIHMMAPLLAVLASKQSRQTWDAVRMVAERRMEDLARLLPVYAWARSVKGFGALGLAILTAEAAGWDLYIPGDDETKRQRLIGEYRTVSGLWKRMGLAVINGRRQGRVSGREAGLEQKYSPQRRAECWTLADSLLRSQMCSELRACRETILESQEASTWCVEQGFDVKEAKKVEQLRPIVEQFGLTAYGHSTGPYGDVYVRRKSWTTSRIALTEHMPSKTGDRVNPDKWTPARCHNDAARVMFKQLLVDLRTEWRRASA